MRKTTFGRFSDQIAREMARTGYATGRPQQTVVSLVPNQVYQDELNALSAPRRGGQKLSKGDRWIADMNDLIQDVRDGRYPSPPPQGPYLSDDYGPAEERGRPSNIFEGDFFQCALRSHYY